MKKNPLIFIDHIFDSIEKIEKFTKDISKTDFEKDEIRQGAIVREIEIIGEATKNIPKDFTKKYPSTPWREIAGMRDKLIHNYFGVDLEIVWEVIKRNIPELKQNIIKIKKETQK